MFGMYQFYKSKCAITQTIELLFFLYLGTYSINFIVTSIISKNPNNFKYSTFCLLKRIFPCQL